MAGGTKVDAPEMSYQEKELLSMVNSMIIEQRAYNDSMRPDYLQKLHYREVKGKDGKNKLVRMSDEEWYNDPNTTSTQRKEWDIYTNSLDRQQKALSGKGFVTPELEEQKQREFQELKNNYSSIQGATAEEATASDTIGNQNLTAFISRWEQQEEADRQIQLNSGSQDVLAMAGLSYDSTTNKIGSLSNLGGMNSGVQNSYMSLMTPYMNYTQAKYQAQAAQAGYQTQQYAAQMGLLGMLGGMAGGYGANSWQRYQQQNQQVSSSKSFKRNIKVKTKKDEDKALSLIRRDGIWQVE